MNRIIIFDLDGTLSDPAEGIRNSFRYAFQKMNTKFDIESRLSELVGPPLHSIFTDVLGWDENDTERGVRLFREYYGTKGVFENQIYSGIPELLKEMKDKGKTLYVATSKLEKYAVQVLEYHSILHHFEKVSGASYKGVGAEKTGIVQTILTNVPKNKLEGVIMVGDKKFDIAAASACGISSVGVLYGFGSERELLEAGAERIVSSVRELQELLNSI